MTPRPRNVDEESPLLRNNSSSSSKCGNGNNQSNSTGVPETIMKPMDHLVTNRRKNICWSVSLFLFFLAVIAILAGWRYHDLSSPDEEDASSITTTTATGATPSTEPSNTEDKSVAFSTGNLHYDDDDVVEELDEEATNALHELNHHFYRQARGVPAGCEGTVLIIRHCDKYGPNVNEPNGNRHCSYMGQERAHFIPTLFQDQDPNNIASSSNNTNNTSNIYGNRKRKRWPRPSYLFALTEDRGDHWNFRERETLQPLAEHFGLDIVMADNDDLPHKIFHLLQTGQLCSKLVVVSWKHNLIPDLAISLGCGPLQGCPIEYPHDSFDQVWELKYVFRPYLNYSTTPYDDATPSPSSPVQSDPTPIATINDSTPTTGNDNDAVGAEGDGPENTDEAQEDDVGSNRRRRNLKHHHHDYKKTPNDAWFLFGSVQQENFDALAFSAQAGDYDAVWNEANDNGAAARQIPKAGHWRQNGDV